MINFNNFDIVPMKLKKINKPFNDKNYLFEPKYDGLRALIYASSKKIVIKNRNGLVINKTFPELMDIKKIVKNKVIFDGEIIVLHNNKPSFSKLQKRMLLKSDSKISLMKEKYPVIFVCFDIIYEDKDLTNLSLIERKKILNKYKDTHVFVKTFYVLEHGINLFNNAKRLKLEGIVAKLKSSKYLIGERSNNWIKIKNIQDADFYIGAIFDNKNHSMGTIVIGEFVNNDFVYRAKVTISKKNPDYNIILNKKKISKSPFIDFTDNKFKYIKPTLKCTVEYIEITSTNHLRQPKYKFLRFD